MSSVHYLAGKEPASSWFESFQRQLPLKVANAGHSSAGYVTLDLGEQHATDALTGDRQFDWHLWVYMCDWDFYKNENRILWRRESNNALAGAILAQLEGEALLAFEYDRTDDCFLMRFSGGFQLHLDPDFYGFEPSDDIFMLFKYAEKDCLSYSPKRRFYRAA